MFRMGKDTIVALSSGPPPCAVAVVRASGPQCRTLAATFGLAPLPPRSACLRTVRSPADGSVLDRALCLFFAGPASATGEDVIELHLHGGPALVERVLADAAAVPGVRAAEPGEFTLRAVLNGRMGLADAEALAELIEARSEAERRRATRLAHGALSERVAQWRARLIAALARAEAQLDFADEADVADGEAEATEHAVDREAGALRGEILAVLDGSREADKLTDGFHIALIGPPNAGKSSLLNALSGRDTAIVSPEAGTTRDVVSVTLDLADYRVTLHDTAGLREGAVGVEAAGIARTHRTRAEADLVVAVVSVDTAPLVDVAADLVVVHKRDLGVPAIAGVDLETSVADAASIARLRDHLARRVAAGMAGAEAALVTRARQRSALLEVCTGLTEARSARALELKAEGLRLACAGMARMTGEIGIEDVLDDVFGRFCIGK